MLPETHDTFPPVEPVLLSAAEEGFWRGSIRFLVVLRLDGCIKTDLLTVALRQLQRRHPKLRATLTPGPQGRSQYRFHEVAPAIPLAVVDYDEGEPAWREEAARMLRPGDGASGPLVEVSVLRSRSQGRSELLLSAHHGIADGRAGMMLLDDLLTQYATVERHGEGASRPDLPVISASRARGPGRLADRLRLARRFVRLLREEARSPQTPLPAGENVPPLSQWVHWVFSREETLALVRRCRRERTSFSGVMVAAACRALLDCLPVSEGSFKWNMAFDVRDKLEMPAPPGTLGSFVGAVRGLCVVRPQETFWELARRVHDDLDVFVKNGGPAVSYNAAAVAASPLFPRMQRVLERVLPSGGQRPALFVTHYGVPDIADAYGSVRPRECTLMFKGDQATGHWLFVEGLVMGQRLNVGFAADGVAPAFWERLHVAVRQHLNAASGL